MNDYPQRINRIRSPWKMAVVPIVSVLLGSLSPLLPIITSAPVLPPLGLMFLLAWRLLRPGLWPVWVGVPLGMFDDLFSGQPVGSAVLIWSLLLLLLELIDRRFLWRGFLQDWCIAALMLIFALVAGLAINNLIAGAAKMQILLPQIIFSICLYPAAVRAVAALDKERMQAGHIRGLLKKLRIAS